MQTPVPKLKRVVVKINDSSGWLDGLRHVESPNCDARAADTSIELIVIHAISLPPGQYGGAYVEQLFTNTLDCTTHPYFATLIDLRVSAHFFIARSGTTTQYVAVDERAWHAGQSRWQGREACNDFSIGIELEGCDEQAFSDAQYIALGRLLDQIRARYPHLDRTRMVGHNEIAPGRKSDPGPFFDWWRVAAALHA